VEILRSDTDKGRKARLHGGPDRHGLAHQSRQ
jgi:hypothetical protein